MEMNCNSSMSSRSMNTQRNGYVPLPCVVDDVLIINVSLFPLFTEEKQQLGKQI